MSNSNNRQFWQSLGCLDTDALPGTYFLAEGEPNGDTFDSEINPQDGAVQVDNGPNGAMIMTIWGGCTVTFDSPGHPCIHVTHYADCTVIEREEYFWEPLVRAAALSQETQYYLNEIIAWNRLVPEYQLKDDPLRQSFFNLLMNHLNKVDERRLEISELLAEIRAELSDTTSTNGMSLS